MKEIKANQHNSKLYRKNNLKMILLWMICKE